MTEAKKSISQAQSEVGKNICVAVKLFDRHMRKAIDGIPHVIKLMNESGISADNLETSDAVVLMYQSLADVHDKPEQAHKILERLICEKGCEPVTNAEIQQFSDAVTAQANR